MLITHSSLFDNSLDKSWRQAFFVFLVAILDKRNFFIRYWLLYLQRQCVKVFFKHFFMLSYLFLQVILALVFLSIWTATAVFCQKQKYFFFNFFSIQGILIIFFKIKPEYFSSGFNVLLNILGPLVFFYKNQKSWNKKIHFF